MSPMRLRFVASSASNLFMTELLQVIAEGARAAGADADVVLDAFPPLERDVAYVIVPHELMPLLAADRRPSAAQLAQTVALCVEQPETIWFEIALEHAARCGAAVDISRVGAAALRSHGVHAGHLQLGYTPALDGWHGAPRPRPVDVLYMGSAAPRRDLLLSGYADVLSRCESLLMIPPHWVKPRERPDFLVGAAKRDLIASAQLMLSVGRQPEPYFEWVRALDAICGGAVYVCDHARGADPLVPGVHFAAGGAEHLQLVAEALLRDPAGADRIRTEAYAFVRDELPMARGVRTLLDAAVALRGAGATASPTNAGPAPDRPAEAGLVQPPGRHDDPVAAQAALAAIAHRRTAARDAARAAGLDPDELTELHRSPAHGQGAPRVSVCVPAYRVRDVLPGALASVAAQDEPGIEVIVIDDGCPDASGELAARWLQDNPWVAGTVLARRCNAGLPAARNAAVAEARAPYVLMLDADNELLPRCARVLADALDADRGATFAYPVIAAHRAGAPDGLLSYLAWDPEILRAFNPVDALALIRRADLVELGGYAEDLELYGWEDYDLWARCAETGRRGVHVARPLARYRRSSDSMLSITDLDQGGRMEILRRRYPRVMGADGPSLAGGLVS